MASLPTDDEIRARAEELGLIDAGAALSPDIRRRVARELHDAAKTPRPPDAVALISRTTHPVPGGVLRIDVTFHPNTATQENSHGEQAREAPRP